MIKFALISALALAVYVALGAALPSSGHAALVVPVLRAVPVVGSWMCYITFKGLAAAAAFSAVSARV